ncbi:MAG TPA: TIGR04222 domain-containing membrane protein [Burkholderiaceae bacterium]
MNPFELHGFAFLTFYLVLGIGGVMLLRWYMNRDDDDARLRSAAREMTQDPYSIAYLRAGVAETVKIATIALIDRGLLHYAQDSGLLSTDAPALKMVRRPIERAVLMRYLVPQAVERNASEQMRACCDEYHQELRRNRLIPNAQELLVRWLLALAISASLFLTAVAKVTIALYQGRHNILFLIVLAAFFTLFPLFQASRRVNGRGRALLNDLKVLFGRLKDRSHSFAPGGANNDAVLLAAVFGTAALSTAIFPFIQQLYPIQKGGDGGSGCGSSCGSSCGGGCGGGCGG